MISDLDYTSFTSITTTCDCGAKVKHLRRTPLGQDFYQCVTCKSVYTFPAMLDQIKKIEDRMAALKGRVWTAPSSKQAVRRDSPSQKMLEFCMWIQGGGFDVMLEDLCEKSK